MIVVLLIILGNGCLFKNYNMMLFFSVMDFFKSTWLKNNLTCDSMSMLVRESFHTYANSYGSFSLFFNIVLKDLKKHKNNFTG